MYKFQYAPLEWPVSSKVLDSFSKPATFLKQSVCGMYTEQA